MKCGPTVHQTTSSIQDTQRLGNTNWLRRLEHRQGILKPKHLLVSGLILIAVGTVWFFRALGLGGGSASVLVLLVGLGCCGAAVFVYLLQGKR